MLAESFIYSINTPVDYGGACRLPAGQDRVFSIRFAYVTPDFGTNTLQHREIQPYFLP